MLIMITFHLHYVYSCVLEVDIDVLDVSFSGADILFHLSPLRHANMKDVDFI